MNGQSQDFIVYKHLFSVIKTLTTKIKIKIFNCLNALVLAQPRFKILVTGQHLKQDNTIQLLCNQGIQNGYTE